MTNRGRRQGKLTHVYLPTDELGVGVHASDPRVADVHYLVEPQRWTHRNVAAHLQKRGMSLKWTEVNLKWTEV